MSKRIEIQEPWWGAWKQFGWAKNMWGVGLNANIVDKAVTDHEDLVVAVAKSINSEYRVSPVTVKNFAEMHKSTYLAGRVKLYVIPHTEMKPILRF